MFSTKGTKDDTHVYVPYVGVISMFYKYSRWYYSDTFYVPRLARGLFTSVDAPAVQMAINILTKFPKKDPGDLARFVSQKLDRTSCDIDTFSK